MRAYRKFLTLVIALSALPVDHSNVLQAWKQVYHSDPPKFLRDSYQR